MKDFSINIKKAIIAELGATFTIDSQTVNVYAVAPNKPSDNYISQELLAANDIGTKDKFITDVSYLISCCTKVNLAAQSSVLLDKISNHVMTTLINRGEGLIDADGDFSIFSIQINGITETKKYLENQVLLIKNIRINLKCQQL